jgi:hypothetical protein
MIMRQGEIESGIPFSHQIFHYWRAQFLRFHSIQCMITRRQREGSTSVHIFATIHCPSQIGSQFLFDKVNKATCLVKYISQKEE